MSNSNLSEQEINELNQSIKIIVSEYSSKKEAMDKLKPIIIEKKTEYNNKIKLYQEITKKIILQENSIEKIQNKIVKIEKHQKTLLLNLTKKCYYHLLDISENINNKLKYESLSKFLKLLTIKNYNEPFEGISILKNEYELKNLLQYLNEIYSNLDKTNIQTYKDFYLFYKENSKSNLEYPFDFLFEFIGTIFERIELKNNLLQQKKELDIENQNKNSLFLDLKKIETEIRQNDSVYRSLGMYRKYIHKILQKYKESKENSDFNSLKKIFLTIENSKNFEQVNNLDNMSSLTMKSEYSFSENSSVNLSISYIVLPSVNNGIINLEEKNKKEKIKDEKKIKVKVEELKIKRSSSLKKNKNFISKNSIIVDENSSRNKINKTEINISENNKNNINNKKNDNNNNDNTINNNVHNNKNNNNNNNNNNNINNNDNNNSKININEKHYKNKILTEDKFDDESSLQRLNTNENIENPQLENKKNEIEENLKNEEFEIFKKINPEKIKLKTQRNLNPLNKINSNTTYLDKNNSKRKFPKFFRNIKGDECENSETMSLIVPNRNLKLIGINNKTLIKDSICDEMIVSNLGTQTIKPSRGDYINELNKKNNGVLNFYLNPELLKKKEDYNALIIEKPIEASNCCVSCT